MKRSILFLALSLLTFTSFSQVEEINGKKYILPDAISGNGCIPFIGSDSMYIQECCKWNLSYNNQFVYTCLDIAQLFHAYDSLKIIGVAGYICVPKDALEMNNYIGIADTSFNILEEQVLTDTLWDVNLPNKFPYYELMFDNPIKIIGDFYVRTDFSRPYYYRG